MRYLVLGVMLILAGCTSLLDSDLRTARAKCSATSTMTVLATCLNDVEGPVWLKDSPDNANAYSKFSDARLELAEKLDSGKINQAEYRDGVARAREELDAAVAQKVHITRQEQRQWNLQDNIQRMDEEQEREMNQPPPPPPPAPPPPR